ncbi:MAG: hypothetical protein DSY50_06515 [Desulfobulbus sp.]|nr:MAG: hypothetical protein DSY50_06515 [Desulfobulbus sp.]RUM39382.1 MAG: hypothetical protein DSY70_05925 [Desulfobulbus sp.]
MWRIRAAVAKIIHLLAVVTDWLLIVAGFALLTIAIKSIDVQAARYVIGTAGVFFAGIGFYYRFRRLHKNPSD